jgi:DNA-binding response OmpR family regulator
VARILIVDDEPDLRGMVRLILELQGHEVFEAHHGAAALRRLGEEPVDLLITDVMMPVMSGSDLIDRLRADATLSKLPVIVLSASPHNVEKADHVMQKPFAPAELRRAAAELLSRDAGR